MKIKVAEWLALPVEQRLALISNAINKAVAVRQKKIYQTMNGE